MPCGTKWTGARAGQRSGLCFRESRLQDIRALVGDGRACRLPQTRSYSAWIEKPKNSAKKLEWSTHLFPFTGDRLGFWRHRVAILRKILDLGYSPLVSDIDAIWLRDPVPYIAGQPQDAIFSPGSIFPEEAHSVWGNVLCAGPCLLRPTPAVLTFLDQVWPHLRTQDDQAAINRQLLTLGLEFEPADLYPMPFRGRDVLQSRDTRTGTVGDLSVALLPNRLFQRLPEPGEPEPLVIHPVSPKVEDTKIAHFREIGLWFEDLMSEAAPR